MKKNGKVGLVVGLGLFAVSVNFSVSLCEIGLAIAGLSLIFGGGLSLEPLRENKKVLIFYALFLAAGLLTAILGISPLRSLAQFEKEIFTALGFLIFLIGLRKTGTFRNVYLTGALGVAIYAIGQVLFGGAARATGTVNAVTFGELMAISGSFAAMCFVFAREKSQAILYGTITAVLHIALIYSGTRGAYLALIVFVVFAVGFLLRKYPQKIKAMFGILIVSGAIGIALNHKSFSRFTEKAVIADDANKGGRLALWKVGLEMWRDYPIAGVGAGNFKTMYPAYADGKVWGNAHSLYVQTLAERGIIGLLALMALFFAFWGRSIAAFLTRKNEHTAWAIAFLPAFAIMNLTETSFQHDVIALSVLFLIAVATRD